MSQRCVQVWTSQIDLQLHTGFLFRSAPCSLFVSWKPGSMRTRPDVEQNVADDRFMLDCICLRTQVRGVSLEADTAI